MSDRLAELLRQKKLLQEHLNWLDQEIAQTATSASRGLPSVPEAGADAPPAPAPQPTPTLPEPVSPTAPASPAIVAIPEVVAPPPTPVAEPAVKPDAMRMADEIIARYQQEDALRPEDTKRGCMVLAGIVLLLMATAFLVSWWFFYSSRR